MSSYTGSTRTPFSRTHSRLRSISSLSPSSSRMTQPRSSVTSARRMLVTTSNSLASFQMIGSLISSSTKVNFTRCRAMLHRLRQRKTALARFQCLLERVDCRLDVERGQKRRRDSFLRLQPGAGDEGDDDLIFADVTIADQLPQPGDNDSAGGFGKDALRLGQQANP